MNDRNIINSAPKYLNQAATKIVASASFSAVQNHINGVIAKQKPIALIIGMGPGGLTTGITLLRKGYEVLMVEKRDTFARSNIIGINKAALGWFQDYQLLDALLANSNKTLNTFDMGAVMPMGTALLNSSSWVDTNVKTTNTIAIKALQTVLYKKFIELGGSSLINTNLALDLDQQHIVLTSAGSSEWTINLNQVNLVVVSDGAQSTTRATLVQYYQQNPENANGLIQVQHIPNQHFANMIITPKPEGLAPSVYLYKHRDEQTGRTFAMGVSVSEHDISLNYETQYLLAEENTETLKRLLNESKKYVSAFLQEKGLALSQETTFYPIDGGRINRGFVNMDFNELQANIDDHEMRHVIFETPSTYAQQMVYANKFVLIGDAKGTSSPMAGLGASLAMANDPIIVGELASSLLTEAEASGKLFVAVEQQLQKSMSLWHEKMVKVMNITMPTSAHVKLSMFNRVERRPQFTNKNLITHSVSDLAANF